MKSNHHSFCGLLALFIYFLPYVLPAREQMLEEKPLDEVEIFAEAYPVVTINVCNDAPVISGEGFYKPGIDPAENFLNVGELRSFQQEGLVFR